MLGSASTCPSHRTLALAAPAAGGSDCFETGYVPRLSLMTRLLDQATHVLFDMDGVLLDTEPLYTIAYDRVMAPYGASLDWETKSTMMGRAALASAGLV